MRKKARYDFGSLRPLHAGEIDLERVKRSERVARRELVGIERRERGDEGVERGVLDCLRGRQTGGAEQRQIVNEAARRRDTVLGPRAAPTLTWRASPFPNTKQMRQCAFTVFAHWREARATILPRAGDISIGPIIMTTLYRR
jgi:hypothetical protein